MRYKKSTIGIILVVIIVILIGFWILIHDNQVNNNDGNSSDSSSISSYESEDDKSTFEDKTVDDSNSAQIESSKSVYSDSNKTSNNNVSNFNSEEKEVTEIINRAETFRQNGNYEQAIKTIDNGLSSYPNSQILLSKREVYVLEKEKNEQKNYTPSNNSNMYEQEEREDNSMEPFYGIWCGASHSQKEAQVEAQTYLQHGIDAKVFITTDWSNLNSEKWYVVSCGVYYSKSDAEAALPQIKKINPKAYIKYSGDWIGGN